MSHKIARLSLDFWRERSGTASSFREDVMDRATIEPAIKACRPQSFIAKYEGEERRIDVIEFIAIARALGADPFDLFRQFMAGENPKKARRKGPAK